MRPNNSLMLTRLTGETVGRLARQVARQSTLICPSRRAVQLGAVRRLWVRPIDSHLRDIDACARR